MRYFCRLAASVLPRGLVLTCLMALATGAGAATVDLGTVHDELALSHGELAWLCDPAGTLTIAAVQARDADFQPLPGNLGRGFTRSACWLRLRLHRQADTAPGWWLAVLPTVLDDVQVYQPRPDGSVHFRQSGDHFPMASRDADYSALLFRLDVPAGDSSVYLRVRTSSSMMAMLYLMPINAFPHIAANRHLFMGLYLGIMFTAPLLGVAFHVTGRRRLHALYLAYLASQLVLGFSNSGLLAEFVFPNVPVVPDQLVGISLGLSITFGLMFFWQLLQLDRQPGRERWFYYLACTGGMLGAIATPLGLYDRVAPIMFCLLLLYVAAVQPVAWRRLLRGSSTSDRMFAFSFLVYLLFLLTLVLPVLGVVPLTSIALVGGQIGIALHLLTLQVSVLVSIHETEAITSETRQLMAQEQEQFEEQREFLTMVTHEMRTPMAIINSAAQSLRMIDDLATQPARSQRYQRIAEAVRRMDLLVDLAVNRDRLSEADPGLMVGVDMVALTRGIVVQMGTEQRGRIRVESDLGHAPVLVQAGLLEFTLINLIDNACKYAPADTPIRIEIAGSAAEGSVLWRVIDQGPGVAPADRERIFEKYYRAGEQSGKPGFGLGLYIAWHVIARYGGKLRYRDRGPGVGACFEICLPWAELHDL